jgi:hypothetical protein
MMSLRRTGGENPVDDGTDTVPPDRHHIVLLVTYIRTDTVDPVRPGARGEVRPERRELGKSTGPFLDESSRPHLTKQELCWILAS